MKSTIDAMKEVPDDLINNLRSCDEGSIFGYAAHAADLLEAAAQEIKQLKDFYGTAPVESFRIIENLRVELDTLKAQRVAVPQGFQWPKPSPCKGQSPVLFDDGYEEGWAKAISTVRAILTAPPSPHLSDNWVIKKQPSTKDEYFIAEGTPPSSVLEVYGIKQTKEIK